MRHTFTLILFLAALILIAGVVEPWPESDRVLWPVGAGYAGPFCDGPEATGALLCEDYEEAQANCALAKAYGTVNVLGEIGYVAAGVPDCANAAAPLDGSYDLAMADSDANESTGWYPLNGGGVGTICSNAQDCVLTFYANIASDTGALSADNIGGIHTDAGTALCQATYRGSNDQVRVSCASGQQIVLTGITLGTTYKMCVWYKQDDDCYVYIDPEGGTWCAGATASNNQDNCTGGGHDEAGWVTMADAADEATIQLDDVMLKTAP